MPEFPSTQAILGELVGMKSYSPSGQRHVVEYIVDLVKRWGLANAQIIDFPPLAAIPKLPTKYKKDPHQNSVTPCNVLLEVDAGNATADETVVCHGHFDKVEPEDYPHDFARNPDQLIADASNPDICYADGSYDMLGGVAAYLTALPSLRMWNKRKLKILLTWGEENESEGSFAICQHQKELIKDVSCFVSTEIPVGGSLNDPPALYIGRQGRAALQLTIRGEAHHKGKITREMFSSLANIRAAKVQLHADTITFEEHPSDIHNLFPPSVCIPGAAKSKVPISLTVPSEVTINLDVIYNNSQLGETDIQHIVRKHIREILGDDNFSLFYPTERTLPYIKPYLEDADSSFVTTAQKIAQEVYSQPIELKGARGVADESIYVHAFNKPCIIHPPTGEGEHTRHECVRISSIDKVSEFVRALMAHEGPLHPENNF